MSDPNGAALAHLKTIIAMTMNCAEKALADSDGVHSIPGWDSLNQLRLAISIEAAFNIELSGVEMAEFTTVAQVGRVLARKLRDRNMGP
jgi:acyl carrier protein